jgi:hypothetical protein
MLRMHILYPRPATAGFYGRFDNRQCSPCVSCAAEHPVGLQFLAVSTCFRKSESVAILDRGHNLAYNSPTVGEVLPMTEVKFVAALAAVLLDSTPYVERVA